MLKNYVAAA
jgi:hypothetical protein